MKRADLTSDTLDSPWTGMGFVVGPNVRTYLDARMPGYCPGINQPLKREGFKSSSPSSQTERG